MDKALAADYRRRGRAATARTVAEALTPRRLRLTIVIATMPAAVGVVTVAILTGQQALSLVYAASAVLLTLAVSGAVAWACVTTWMRRDRRGQPRLSFIESGELGRVTREDGSVEVPPERRETVARAAAVQGRLAAALVVHQCFIAVCGLLAAVGTLILPREGWGWVIPALLGLRAVSAVFEVRMQQVLVGCIDLAHELATSSPGAEAAEQPEV